MRGNNQYKFIGIFLFLILLISPVLAAIEDFQYTAPSNIEACACSNFVIKGEIINTGDVHSHYFVSDFGTASSWTKPVPDYFNMMQESTKEVLTFVNVPCNAEGKYTLYTSINASLGLQKIHTSTLNIKKCNIINVIPIKTKREVCAGVPAVYEFIIENKGFFNEEVIPSISYFEKESEFNLLNYSIKSSESMPVYLYIASLNDIGTYHINVSFKAVNSGYIYHVPIEYEAIDCEVSVPISDSDDLWIKENLFLVLLWFAGFLFLLLLILFFILLFKVIKKRKANKTLNSWIKESDTKDKVINKSKVSDAKKLSEKKLKVKKTKDMNKNKKVILGILILLLFLLLLGLLAGLGLILGLLPGQTSIVSIDQSITDGINDTSLNLTHNATTSINESDIAINESVIDINDTSLNESELIESVSMRNPFVKFFTNYSSSCGLFISLFFVFFVLSLFLFLIKPNNEWTNKKKILIKCLKYFIPLFFLLSLLLILIFCVFNNMPESEWPGRCTIVTIHDVDLDYLSIDLNESLNATQLMNETSVIIQKESLANCFCHTIFGHYIRLWLCILLLILFFLLLFFIIWLIIIMPFLVSKFRAWRVKRILRRQEKIKNIQEAMLLKRKENDKLNKKNAEKIKSQNNQSPIIIREGYGSSGGSLFKDILLLLVLFLLLFLIGLYFYSSQPDSYLGDNDFIENQTDINDSLLDGSDLDDVLVNDSNLTDDSLVDDDLLDDDIELFYLEANVSTDNKNLRCNTTFYDDDGGLISLDEIGDFNVNYSWYKKDLIDNDYNLLISQKNSGLLSNRLTKVGDSYICEVNIYNDNFTFSVNSSEIKIISLGFLDENITDQDPVLLEVEYLIAFIEESNLTESFQYTVVEAGVMHEIDLNNHFIDPDGDELFFSVNNITSEEIAIDIWKSIATIKAKKDYVGIVNATFIAEDPSGETVSAVMTIIVKPHEKSDLINDLLNNFIGYSIILIIILILLILCILLLYFILRDGANKNNNSFSKKGEDNKKVNKKNSNKTNPKKTNNKNEKNAFFKNF
jgi:predicted PurR-regulated permease PerM